MGFIGKSVLVSLVALWCFTSSVFTEEVNHVTQTPSLAPAPAPYHHGHHHPHPPHHHHPHPHPHPHPPAKSPVKPPVKAPVSPPAKPPVKPPVYPPTKAPVKPPTKPPVKPPVSPPAKPPVKPPVYPPTKAPVKPPTKPPVKPPVYPPTKAPVKPPTKPPVKPPVSPPAKPPVKPPVYPPTKAPVKPPVSPPTKPPVTPPVYPPKFNRSLVAVRGTVYCKSCKYAAFNTLLGAKPIEGATVKLVCKSKKNITAETLTDKNGYFLLLAPKTVTNFGFRGCRVYLVKSKDYKCSKVSKLFGGDVGAELKPERRPGKGTVVVNKLTYGLFNVGPFAFNPTCPK
ncbi:unnamed protein product [Arabidopsis lyrata]|uniref:non-classical arabinogalactan protein 31 n=1 Tax=Arabidopsis lyrata subsp. lyrata TaxID=81972 RepID=UPI0003E73C0F|nr:non-classical arabinogalactan protein 31 [Arabidopsis lyrata subsp. lyrata]CAH8253765.1 unnamed protein product [Arabidopsis lyrata]|eukprot:XP_020869819.1 non-classical arabinogalactan protein 31 [Arabidopsis lyrata subsp. lyrata]